MRNLSLVLILMLFVSCGRGFKKSSENSFRTQESQEVDSYSINQEYLELLNEHRARLKLAPMQFSDVIESVVIQHSKAMGLKTRQLGHMGLDQRCRRIKNRLAPHKQCEELVGMGPKNPKELLKSWLSSSELKGLLVSTKFTHTAIGLYRDDQNVMYWTQIVVELE